MRLRVWDPPDTLRSRAHIDMLGPEGLFILTGASAEGAGLEAMKKTVQILD